MYRHSPADLITYYMLPRDWRERIPVRLGVGTRQSPARRGWIAITASIVPALPFSLFVAAIVFAILNTRLSLWVTLCGSVAAGAIVVAIMNMFLDRFIFHKIIWLRRIRCNSLRGQELTPTLIELLQNRRQPYLDHLARKPAQSLPGRGAPPHNILPQRAMLSYSNPTWRVLMPKSVVHAMALALGGGIAAGLTLLIFGVGTSHQVWRVVVQSLLSPIALFGYFLFDIPANRRILGMVRRHCPQCGHDISETGGDAGPRRCPECGSHWPLVPPPTPIELHEIEKQLSSSRAKEKGTASL